MAKTTMICPCKGCTDRRAGSKDSPSCHASCERYNEWREQFTAYKPDVALDMQFDTINKIKRQQHLKQKR